MEIPIHPLTNDPTAAWKEISKNQRVIKVTMKPPQVNVAFNKARVVAMSDTHSLTPYIKFEIPEGDIFIHAGDFTKCGQLEEVVEFNKWLGTLPHKHKVVIAGNHELSFDKTFTHPFQNKNSTDRTKLTGLSVLDDLPTLGNAKENIESAIQTQNIRDILTNCIYLEDEMLDIYGVRIYGSPWQPEFCKWAFNVPRGRACLDKWDLIPEGIDILITHTPPVGHGDLCCSGVRAGCVELLTTVQKRVRPKYHVFGHVHEGYGITSDGRIIYVNASTCDINYIPNNPPIVFDVTLPPGMRKI
ncbi:metallophosphoesterase domain-containing protein 1 [Teleopsis dalmanni]|uniref:metallophosphoesterase domain-containing protein 1 n=1 Tax=Teleopsis dalmanni TaxID=139649 RepID=UPI0018CDD4F7|nr:metallophosphoesterase domain-containing protein 1 [Teleopsis dalmanni]XP_037939420.1 metallophosphoesterase domain-containing protein 1 [Teleopsis dalmanni]XP_037939421.1 metallophosphoesterase domain-containing protein 1 [Teleopsis dalmanni]XP_037939422.1 metallophosphoesterase domain-containing protein 1 [Teleopsis dalmanni]XP_037939423.1 metallophosphoesterase domain-containing protein 1 [Teleopsis dalmanni]XP_037939424.1 metallophosphoesterase domain-containing protein 1 [Teleopsis dal